MTGELAWETRILDYKVNPAHHSAGPIVADGKLISGRSCRPLGGPEACVILAHDARTGRELWRRRTLPAPGEPGDETLGFRCRTRRRRHVGTWMPPSYDPELELVYIGTGVTAPAPRFDARRRRSHAPLPQLDPGARRFDRRESAGTTST